MKRMLLLMTACLILGSAAFALDEEGSERGWLGVTLIQTKDADTGETENSGVKIMSIFPDSPAKQAGLASDDIIVKVDDKEIVGLKGLLSYLKDKSPGDAVNVWVLRGDDEKNFAVVLGEKPHDIKKMIKKHDKQLMIAPHPLEHMDVTKRGYIGVQIQDLTPELREYFGADADTGILISGVNEDTPAFDAGLKAGDVILAANGEPVKSTLDLQTAIRKLEKGDEARLSILRNQSQMDVSVYVEEKEAKKVSVFVTPGKEGKFIVQAPNLEYDVDSSMIHIPNFDIKQFEDDEGKTCIKIVRSGDSDDNKDVQKYCWVTDGHIGEGLEQLQQYMESDDFKEKMDKLQVDVPKKLKKKIRKLERRIEELEEKLMELQEE
ncbi:PDZ domain-containing protein [Acidobacteriota bacterium]